VGLFFQSGARTGHHWNGRRVPTPLCCRMWDSPLVIRDSASDFLPQVVRIMLVLCAAISSWEDTLLLGYTLDTWTWPSAKHRKPLSDSGDSTYCERCSSSGWLERSVESPAAEVPSSSGEMTQTYHKCWLD